MRLQLKRIVVDLTIFIRINIEEKIFGLFVRFYELIFFHQLSISLHDSSFQMADEMKAKLNFIRVELPQMIMNQPSFEGHEVVPCSAESKSHLDGFMSAIFTVKLETKSCDGR
jgi:hypothetical protein